MSTPSNSEWQQAQDPASGKLYYYNTKTKATQWEPPRQPLVNEDEDECEFQVPDSSDEEDGPAEKQQSETFVPAPSFQGPRQGFVFKSGPSGLGYYKTGATSTSRQRPQGSRGGQPTKPPPSQTAAPLINQTPWTTLYDEASKKAYFFNNRTRRTQWNAPPELSSVVPPGLWEPVTLSALLTILESKPKATEPPPPPPPLFIRAASFQGPKIGFEYRQTGLQGPGYYAVDEKPCWAQYRDPGTQKPYYYNVATRATQWVAPPAHLILPSPGAAQGGSHAGAPKSLDQVKNDVLSWLPAENLAAPVAGGVFGGGEAYRSHGSFNRDTGRFVSSSAEGYWAERGLESDREGRQLAAHIDLSTLEANRQEAMEKKRRLQNNPNIDWKKYKKGQKKKKQAAKDKWLYHD